MSEQVMRELPNMMSQLNFQSNHGPISNTTTARGRRFRGRFQATVATAPFGPGEQLQRQIEDY